MGISSLLGVMSTVQMSLFTALRGTRVGEDMAGNVYYRGKARKGGQRERRWVVYKNDIEASEVPAEWHGWLHHQTDAIPQERNALRRPWQKPHRANKTGTPDAFYPQGHMLSGGHRAPATGDYVAWTPDADAQAKTK